MGFHNVQFPTDISYGSAGGPGYMTEIIEVDGGAEELVARWSLPRRVYDVAYGIKSRTQLAALQTFFVARLGAANGFRYKDWLDFSTAEDGQSAPTNLDAVIGTGDGSTDTFQLVKRYTSGSETRTRALTKIVTGTTLVAVAGVAQLSGWTVNEQTGIITFTTAPASGSITAGCEFDVPVRFHGDTDRLLSMSIDDYGNGTARQVNLIEIVGDTAAPEEFYYGGSLTLSPMTANYTLSVADGRAIYVVPATGSLRLILPDPTTLPLGGPHFFIINGSLTNAVSVRYPAGTVLFSLAASSGKTMCVVYDASSVKEWHWL